ncbi:MAG TPA: arginine deiminase family protein, partial [Acidimicrobiales bacterium]|nr:arginine deiminase family protein [Acidimicrobiales bacterium]
MTAKKALVRRPSPRLAEGIVTHIAQQPVDCELGAKQWGGYVEALEACGWETVEVPPADDCPDGVFIEDTMVVYKDLAVIARPGAASRKPEVVAAEAVVEGLGLSINWIRSPGTLDGGDVLKVGDSIYVGVGGRTNPAAVRQLRDGLTPLGATVIAVPVRKVLHLKSAVTALPDGSIIGYLPLVDEPSIFPSFRAVPEESGAHVVVLDEHRILMAADCPRSAEMFAGLGYE